MTTHTPDFNVDGYFLDYPAESEIWLSRTKNDQPCMISFPWGKGRVVLSTLYLDWAAGNHQGTVHERLFFRDLVSFLLDKPPVLTHEGKTVRVALPEPETGDRGISFSPLLFGPDGAGIEVSPQPAAGKELELSLSGVPGFYRLGGVFTDGSGKKTGETFPRTRFGLSVLPKGISDAGDSQRNGVSVSVASDLENYYTRTRDGELIPLSTIVTLKESAQPQSLKRFQQLNAVSITFAPRPGVSKGEALAILDQAAKEVLPQGYSVDYAGESRQFKQEGAAMLVTLALALIVIFLVLSAQFESFRDALIMLLTVPMAICGALLTLNVLALLSGILGFMQIEAFPGMSINIYTQVGLVTLVGVISKHGILIVEFANKLQIEQGLSKREAIEEATGIRLRPVLMTTAALVFAMVPLLIAKGPGAASRFSMGVVIVSGMTIGTLFTLFVLPAFYLYLARDHAHDADHQKAAEGEAASLPPPEPQHG